MDVAMVYRFTVRCSLSAVLLIFATHVMTQNVPTDFLLTDPLNLTGNMTLNCLLKPMDSPCPDPDLHFFLYTGKNATQQVMKVSNDSDAWFSQTRFDTSLPTVVLIHGYRGGDSLMPMVILKNAYIKLGTHNVIMVDWGQFVRPPCYVQAISNMKPVASCIGHLLTSLQRIGVDVTNITCVGHSIGAHVCGLVANYVEQKLDKIIGLDPARPLLELAVPNDRLDATDARVVQVVHTSTQFYGLTGMQGSVDFCVNSGVQPFCQGTRNPQLCGHVHAICFMAESLYQKVRRQGAPCEMNCPQDYVRLREGNFATMGYNLEPDAQGMYCLVALEAPFCRNETQDPEYGDPRCCPVFPTLLKNVDVAPAAELNDVINDELGN